MESIRAITHGKIIMEDFLMLMTPLEKKKQTYVSAPVGSDDRRLKKKICVAILMDVTENCRMATVMEKGGFM